MLTLLLTRNICSFVNGQQPSSLQRRATPISFCAHLDFSFFFVHAPESISITFVQLRRNETIRRQPPIAFDADRLLDSTCECIPNPGRQSIKVVSVWYSAFLGNEGLVSIVGDVRFPPYCTHAAISGHMLGPNVAGGCNCSAQGCTFFYFSTRVISCKRIYRKTRSFLSSESACLVSLSKESRTPAQWNI